jgi:hypothetical protein
MREEAEAALQSTEVWLERLAGRLTQDSAEKSFGNVLASALRLLLYSFLIQPLTTLYFLFTV